MMKQGMLYIPNLLSFTNGNTFLGSFHGVRFKLTPDTEQSCIHGEFWYGPLCYECSEMDGAQDFPLTEDGIAEMTQWIRAQAAEGQAGA